MTLYKCFGWLLFLSLKRKHLVFKSWKTKHFSSLHWLVFILFYTFFVQWSIIQLTSRLPLPPPPPPQFLHFKRSNYHFIYTLTSSFVSHTHLPTVFFAFKINYVLNYFFKWLTVLVAWLKMYLCPKICAFALRLTFAQRGQRNPTFILHLNFFE